MTRLLGLIPFWAWLLVAAAVATAFGGLYTALERERAAHQTTIAKYALAVAASTQAALDQSEKHRKLEGELREAQATNAALAKSLEDALAGARGSAARAAAGLQTAVAAAAARAREGCAATTAVAVRETTSDAIGVLANVLGRVDERAGLLADLADRRGLAGRACEREYDTLERALKAAGEGAAP